LLIHLKKLWLLLGSENLQCVLVHKLASPLAVTGLNVESKRVSLEVRPQLVPSTIGEGGDLSASTSGRHVDGVESEVMDIGVYMCL
jgi:hypothetical protein